MKTLKNGDKVRYRPVTKSEEVLQYYSEYLDELSVYTVSHVYSLGNHTFIKLKGVKDVKGFEILQSNLELYIDEDEIPFTITCKKCNSTNCIVSPETEYDYDSDDNLTPMGEYYEITCEDCKSEYSSRK